MILKYTCHHEYQDRKYGHKNRVHNPCVGANNTVDWRCTVCEKKKSDKK